jgi:hypothetical protein
MILFILKLLIIIYLIYMIFKVKSLIQFNPNANIITIELPDKDKIMIELKEKSPLIINNSLTAEFTIDSMNLEIPGYIINDKDTLLSLDQLCKSEFIQVLNNSKLVDDFKLTNLLESTEELLTTSMKCDSNYSLSLYRGIQSSPLLKNYRETLFIQPLQGSLTIYLFNPKHEKDIKGLELQSIKKWGIKINLQKNTLLYIPPEWFYYYETKEDTILIKGQSDTYSTWLFNYIRKK